MSIDINQFTKLFMVDDLAIHIDEVPWVPQGDRVWFKPVRFSLANGQWINLLKVKPGGVVNRHRHTGGQVMAYTLQGQWRYLEREWVAKPGTFVYEPPGDIHTLVVEGEEEMMTLFILEGSIQYLNDQDEIIGQDDVFSKIKRYKEYCEQHNLEMRKDLFF
ncbi:2,4'-dihydroxyacetophenone dioxygenase family protein [Brevibacillus massiliensis]|jgi:quercetin dioxygenase-like cupin family protein|uniref:2,4'-dihydroxyacetophenone dioxygenase family protein n=1 Tax=Brevibacillus massiliensis TaxID=1118054 RepID=UPI00031F5BB2|nr:2,4'-dihydroxyacetophenone dioxygenase family protein [Brevibacillus massiliensis]